METRTCRTNGRAVSECLTLPLMRRQKNGREVKQLSYSKGASARPPGCSPPLPPLVPGPLHERLIGLLHPRNPSLPGIGSRRGHTSVRKYQYPGNHSEGSEH